MNLIKKIFQQLFPCNFNEPLCKDNFFGCRCGKKLFKSKKVEPQTSIIADPYGSVREPLLKWLSERIGKPAEQYPAEKFVAPPTELERQSFDWLRKYAGQEVPEAQRLAMGEIRKTLTGEYDPTTSPYYQAVKAEAARNLAQIQEDIASMAAGGGRYWTGARLSQQREAATDVTQALNRMLGKMAEAERVRRLQTVPIAQQIGAYEEERPLRITEALQQYGALERALQQAQLEAVYREWLRSVQEYPLNIAEIIAGIQRPPEYYYRPGYTKPGLFSRITGGIFG